MESGSNFQKTSHSPSQSHVAFCRVRDSRENLQQSTLARSVQTNNSNHVTRLEAEIYISKSPHPLWSGGILASRHSTAKCLQRSAKTGHQHTAKAVLARLRRTKLIFFRETIGCDGRAH